MGKLNNSELVDPQAGIFSVLGLVTCRLAGPYLWQSVDLNEESCRGTAFNAFERDGGQPGEFEIASVTVVDATGDPTEPDVSALEPADVAGFDNQYREAIQNHLDSTGVELVRWLPSQTKQSGDGKVLCVAYIANEQGKERHFVIARTKVKGRNVVAIGAYDAATKHRLAAPIFDALRQIIGEADPTLAWSALRPFMPLESPREILQADFTKLRDLYPIAGGWGHTQADACVIDKNDPIVDQSESFNGVGIEYQFVEKRIYEEMIVARPMGYAFAGIEWKLQSQRLVSDGDRRYDHLVFDVKAFHEKDWEDLRAEFEGPNGASSPDFDVATHDRKRQAKIVRTTSEFWFDVTSFYGE